MKLGEYLISQGWRRDSRMLWHKPDVGEGLASGRALWREWDHERERERQSRHQSHGGRDTDARVRALIEAARKRKTAERVGER